MFISDGWKSGGGGSLKAGLKGQTRSVIKMDRICSLVDI